MIKKLAEKKLVEYKPYQGVVLTEKGRKMALEVIRHHRLIELFLVKALGYKWDEVHDEAERLEHVISETFEERIAEFLGHPEFDPHGEPIPTKDGEVSPTPGLPLNSFDAGSALIVSRINDRDPEKLRYFARLGLFPGEKLSIVEKEPFSGVLWIKIAGKKHPLGLEAIHDIFAELVSPDKEDSA